MGLRLFGASKREQPAETTDWPQLPGPLAPIETVAAPVPLPPPAASKGISEVPVLGPEEDLLERVTAFRSAVADALYDISKDYQMLCNLAHADLAACDEIISKLRDRLAGNIHYEVLAKLDDIHAMVSARVNPSP
jgi:hypothetical protein